ncbi:MAG: hypothetical protein LBL94_07525 [Prevotellaceae bacterium]|nr:hypothetical protein [Prevotellaceae bacterium]
MAQALKSLALEKFRSPVSDAVHGYFYAFPVPYFSVVIFVTATEVVLLEKN